MAKNNKARTAPSKDAARPRTRSRARQDVKGESPKRSAGKRKLKIETTKESSPQLLEQGTTNTEPGTETQIDDTNDVPMTPPITTDMVFGQGQLHMNDLDSSPIKKASSNDNNDNSERNSETNNENDNMPIESRNTNINSSPLKMKKSVAFSDNLASEVQVSPTKGSQKTSTVNHTPKKSILKLSSKEEYPHSNSIEDQTFDTNSFFPDKPSFWSEGTIIQLPPESHLLDKLLHGSVNVLRDRQFDKRFEVYASLNHNLKINRSDLLLQILLTQVPSRNSPSKRLPGTTHISFVSVESNHLSTLSGIIQRDVCGIESQIFSSDDEDKENTPIRRKGDPFSIRIISQALKCMSFLMADHELNNCLPLDDIRWFYMHSCSMIIKPSISKSLITPYISIIKECKFDLKKKKMIFNSGSNADIPEHMLSAVLNSKNFPSTSLICEKFITFKNLVQNFPVMMCNNFKHWFETYLLNLCDLNSPLHTKVMGTAVISLLEVSRVYLRNREVKFMVQQCVDRNLPTSVRSLSNESELELPKNRPNSTILNHIVNTIHDLVAMKNYKPAMDIWVAITLLVCNKEEGFEKWSKIDEWVNCYRVCLAASDPSARMVAISAWKAVVYNLCISDLDSLAAPSKAKEITFDGPSTFKISERLQSKFDLLFTLVRTLDLSDSPKEVIDVIDSGVLSIFYSLINQQTLKSDEYFKIYWDKVVEPCFELFYFSETPLKQIPFLGAKLFIRLMRRNTTPDERKMVPIRCLSNEPITLNDINSINSRWAYQNHDRVLKLMRLIVSSDSIKIGLKLSMISSYCNLVKPFITNEVNHSYTTCQVKNGVCTILMELFKTNSILNDEHILKTFRTAYETFGIENLVMVNEATEDQFNFIDVIINKIVSSPLTNFPIWINKLFCDFEAAKALPLVYCLRKCSMNKELSDLVDDKLKECKINISSDAELKVVGLLFQDLSKKFTFVAKSVIQDIVLLNEKSFEQAIKIIAVQRWSMPIFEYFILLIHNAPHNYMKQMAFNLILLRFEKDDAFVHVIRFLVDNKLDLELFNIRKAMMKKFQTLKGYFEFEFKSILRSYLTSLKAAGNFVLLDSFCVTSHEYNYDIHVLADPCLDKLPLYREAVSRLSGAEGEEESTELLPGPEPSPTEPIETAPIEATPTESASTEPTPTESAPTETPIEPAPAASAQTEETELAPPESTPTEPEKIQSAESESTQSIPHLNTRHLEDFSSDDESDVPDNTFSSETGDPESNDDSYIAAESAAAEEFSCEEDNNLLLLTQDNASFSRKLSPDNVSLSRKRSPDEDLLGSGTKRTKTDSINPSEIEVPETNPDQEINSVSLSLESSEVSSTQQESKVAKLHKLLESFQEQDIINLSPEERDFTETRLLAFMLDIKRIK